MKLTRPTCRLAVLARRGCCLGTLATGACGLAALAATACSATLPATVPAGPVALAAAAAPSPSVSALPDTGDDMSPGIPIMGKFLLYDDFEHGMAKWQVAGGTQDVTWRLLHAHSCTGDYVMHFGHDDQSTFTGAATDGYLTYGTPVDLTGVPFPVLTYTVKGQTAPTTAMVLQPEIRHGQGSWQPVGIASQSRYEYGYTRYLDLRAVTKDAVQLRFHLHVDAAAAATAGMYLDDVGVVAVTPGGAP